jgi:hypothetical protein
MFYSTKNKNRDAARRVRQKLKNVTSPQRKRNIKRGAVKKIRRNIRRKIDYEKEKEFMAPLAVKKIRLKIDYEKEKEFVDPLDRKGSLDTDFITWARGLPIQSALKHQWATDIQMTWRKKMTSERIQLRAERQAIRKDINRVLRTLCELKAFTDSSYVHLLDCVPLTSTLEFLHDRIGEISKIHYAALPSPPGFGSNVGPDAYVEWYRLNGAIDRACTLLEKLMIRIVGVIRTRSDLTLTIRTLAKSIKKGRFGMSFGDIKNSIRNERNKEEEEEAWKSFVHVA